ncbi:unnamed protein product [Lampetra planeri]
MGDNGDDGDDGDAPHQLWICELNGEALSAGAEEARTGSSNGLAMDTAFTVHKKKGRPGVKFRCFNAFIQGRVDLEEAVGTGALSASRLSTCPKVILAVLTSSSVCTCQLSSSSSQEQQQQKQQQQEQQEQQQEQQ